MSSNERPDRASGILKSERTGRTQAVTPSVAEMTSHLVRMMGIVAAIVTSIIYPFLPGSYDSLAMPLSAMAQTVGPLATLLLAPAGASWLVYESWKRRRIVANLPARASGYYFALVSTVAASVVALAVSVVAFATVGLSLGIPVLALWLYIVSRLIPGLGRLRDAEGERFNVVPLYLVFIPVVVLLSQLTLAGPVTEFSRNRAVANAEELIADIEQYYARQGRYPPSLSAVWKDYEPSVVGVERFQYAPNGDGYDLLFEQPRFVLNNVGTREFVVYNKLGQHLIPSHAAWILLMSPEQLQTRQGWYAVHDGPRPHWRYFWFD